MKTISLENLHEKPQHLSILDMLWRYPEGLSLHELTYLLTTKKNMQKLSELNKRFNPYFPHNSKIERKNIFKTRQRINDCLTDLKHLKFIIKNKKKYKISLAQIDVYVSYNKHLIESIKFKMLLKLMSKYPPHTLGFREEYFNKDRIFNLIESIYDDDDVFGSELETPKNDESFLPFASLMKAYKYILSMKEEEAFLNE